MSARYRKSNTISLKYKTCCLVFTVCVIISFRETESRAENDMNSMRYSNAIMRTFEHARNGKRIPFYERNT